MKRRKQRKTYNAGVTPALWSDYLRAERIIIAGKKVPRKVWNWAWGIVRKHDQVISR